MKFILALILLTFFFKFSFGQECCADQLKFPLKEIVSYCQQMPDSAVGKKILFYDSLNRLIKIISYSNFVDTINYTYNVTGQLISETFSSPSVRRKRFYRYDDRSRLIYEGYENSGVYDSQLKYYYTNQGKLFKKVEECNSNKYETLFYYDTAGNLIRKSHNGFEFIYQYSGNKLIKETKKFRNKSTEIIYEYNPDGLLTKKFENQKILEENIYENNNLIKKLEFYYGIDPCIDRCCSQYIYKYKYY